MKPYRQAGLLSAMNCIPHTHSEALTSTVTVSGDRALKGCYCLVTKPCPTLCDPTDCSLPGSSVHKILQARILEWVAIPFSRGSFQPRDRTQVFLIAGRLFTV